MFTDPLKNLKTLQIKDTDVVADLGAGTGFYSLHAAEFAEKVYAVELNRDFLKTISNKVKDEQYDNVECLLGDVEKLGGTKIGDSVVDKVIASNVFFQVENKDIFISEIKRILKNKGSILFIDWSENSPIPHKGEIFSKVKTLEMFKKDGFSQEREIDAGNYHYGMILIKD